MLSAKIKYGILATLELFMRSDEIISTKEISEKYDISLNFLEQILCELKNNNIILSTRGPKGGYRINLEKSINLKDIISALSDALYITNCKNKLNCTKDEKCSSHDFLSQLENQLLNYIQNISIKSLQSLLNKEKKSIYADYQATTPVMSDALNKMIPFFSNSFGNPHSSTHSFGWEAKEAVDLSRMQIANVINANVNDIIFTSGATESNNLAILGAAKFYKTKKHIVTIKTEHKCVLNTCLSLEEYEISYIDVDKEGIVNLNLLDQAIRPDTLLVSISGVNSEIGVIQPLEEIGKICAKHDILFHSDIAQAFGKIPIDVQKMNIHFASISSHKVYGPKGVGALYINRTQRSGRKRAKIKPLFFGGGQEFGLRSGTVPTPLVVGFGEAASISQKNMLSDNMKLQKYFNRFVSILEEELPKIKLNGHRSQRYFGNINISFRGVEGESLLLALKGIAASSGSACTSNSLETSYVLKTIGLDDYMAHSSIRFSFGRFTSMRDVEYIASEVISSVKYLRSISPFWEMEEQGQNLNQIQWAHCH